MTKNKEKPTRIYLDTASATPLDPLVLKAMLPYLTGEYGNPSSLHWEGVASERAIRAARESVARVLGGHADEIVFTSGGTEGDNLAVIGVARALLARKKIVRSGHLIVSAIEHRAVLEPCAALEREGWSVTRVTVNKDGIIDLKQLKEALRPDTVLVSVMYVNNEIGTIQPIREIAKILRHWRKETGDSRLPYFHTDACQAPRFLPLGVEQLGVDLMTLNGSKIYGPKGTGCLFVRRNTFIEPVLLGGGQERGLRSGTENVAGIIGFAKALEIASTGREKESVRLLKVRDYFIGRLKVLPGVTVNGSLKERAANNINATFGGVFSEYLVLALDAAGIACSAGSACSSHAKDDSHVIISLGKDTQYADSTVRFTLDRTASKKEVDAVIAVIKEILKRNRKIII